MTLISVKNVTKVFMLGKTEVLALADVTIQAVAGEFLALAGPSGSGKTTLLNLIGCIDQPTSGDIEIDGKNVKGLSSNALADIRLSKLSFIFQTFNLIPVLTAYENVEYPLLKRNLSASQRRERIEKSLNQVALGKYLRHRPEELSGGQRQRVAIARALVTQPKIILADEPTANLDQKTGQHILEIMKKINQEQKTLFVFSTHDPNVLSMASRIVSIRDGKISSCGYQERRKTATEGPFHHEKRKAEDERRKSKGRRLMNGFSA
jgi:putative ABC transport system ATP-binding protein